jgi:DNA-binding CsgD family transcriptional regulator
MPGFASEAEAQRRQRARELYQIALADRSWEPEEVCRRLGWSAADLSEAVARLVRLGLLGGLREAPSGWCALSPHAAAGRLVEQDRRHAQSLLTALGRTREALVQMLEEFQPLHSEQLSQVEVAASNSELATVLAEVAGRAASEVLTLHPSPVPSSEQLAAGRERNERVLRRGATMRTVYQAAGAGIPHLQRHLRELVRVGAQVRTAPTLPLRLIIADQALAVVSADRPGTGNAALVIRSGPLVVVLRQVFEHCWGLASELIPVDGSDPVGPSGLTARHIEVVRMMAAGLTDEAISRKLGLSDRTVRRIVSELMRRAGAESRFQAGVHAVRLGWLT